ncbi:DUF2309 domain-containing protein [Crateriforma conspicua]|nr:DUF2309 domain-containing protein [Crateriforma conspicua]
MNMPALEMDAAIGRSTPPHDPLTSLRQQIEHAAHLLPSQGPITVFVHHNTLHAFEDLDFDGGVQAGGRTFGCQAYLPEDRYRTMLEEGRIRVEDLEAVLHEDLEDEADRLVSVFCTRYALRLSMMQFPLHAGSTHELRWVVAETDALRRFRDEVSPAVREEMLTDTRAAVQQRIQKPSPMRDTMDEVLQQFDSSKNQSWSDRRWEAFVLNYLWRVCCEGVRIADPPVETMDAHSGVFEQRIRHRDVLIQTGADDADVPVHETLIRFCAAFLDQGFAAWNLPHRSQGFYRCFLSHHVDGPAPTRWLRSVQRECRRLSDHHVQPLQSIRESLQLLGVEESEQEPFITQTLLALRGWSGMVWQMETNAEWTPHPAPPGSLVEFLAIRLMLDRIAIAEVARNLSGHHVPLNKLRPTFRRDDTAAPANHFEQRAYTVFQLAQVLGWRPRDLENLAPQQWNALLAEIESFPALERRRIYHRAFERKYRNETLDAVIAHSRRPNHRSNQRPVFQIVCCLDEREESFRRHLEEVQPDCETFGIAGFFGVAMYYRGAADAHYTPLCPVNVKPDHFVVETPVYSAVEAERRRADARRTLGHATHRAHLGSRSFLGGALTGIFGSIAAVPLVARIMFPRTTAQIRRWFGSIVRTQSTELCLERLQPDPGSDNGHIGYSVEEMAGIVEGGLRALGLANPDLLSELVVICGHGSASLNNPHEAAHDCGACGGGRGGPNARAFAQMANDVRVRSRLAERGLTIPDSTFFIGGYHNTCDDTMSWYDLDRVPLVQRKRFEAAKADIDEARKRSAHERCRRFESAGDSLDFDEALRHVEGRAEDLSQTRPEYGHATNALCFVGRREWSRGLFLDRRAFLTSYDPTQDDDRSSILEQMLQAVIPVCAGINLEYYFSYVDPIGYGCGTKLPHNITSLLGVMDGAESDLRPGLPWQMVEIHEPVRLLFVIETTPQAMKRIIDDNEAIARLVKGGWVQLAIFDPDSGRIRRWFKDDFVLYAPHEREIPAVNSSPDWYAGKREHLGFASILSASAAQPGDVA